MLAADFFITAALETSSTTDAPSLAPFDEVEVDAALDNALTPTLGDFDADEIDAAFAAWQ